MGLVSNVGVDQLSPCIELISCKCAKSCKGNCNYFKADPLSAISRRREILYVDKCLGMLNDTENDRQCRRHREMEHGCHLNEMEI